MFTPADRARIRDALVASARADPRITGIALTGSASVGGEDAWSDIDLAFGVRNGVALTDVLGDLTQRMHDEHGALDTYDVIAGAWTYRVFLLPNTLQVDLGVARETDFGARAPTFRLLHGRAVELPPAPAADTRPLIGLAWLYALHARSCIARGQLWRAEVMVSGLRDQVLALACVRHGLPAAQGRGTDALPVAVTAPLVASLVTRLDAEELRRAFGVALGALIDEIAHVDRSLATRLADVLHEVVRTTH